jgi:hypothetical protein
MRSIKVATTISSAALSLSLTALSVDYLQRRQETGDRRTTVKFFESAPGRPVYQKSTGFDETETMKQYTATQRSHQRYDD